MPVQLGGGTQIGQALEYCEQHHAQQPSRTLVVLLSDFQDTGRDARLRALADACESVGLVPLARALSRVTHAEPANVRAAAALSAAHVIAGLSALRRTLQVRSG